MRKNILSITVLAALSCALVGCFSDGDLGTKAEVGNDSKADLDKRMKEIEANDKMPPQAKAVAIGQLKGRYESASKVANAMKDATKKGK